LVKTSGERSQRHSWQPTKTLKQILIAFWSLLVFHGFTSSLLAADTIIQIGDTGISVPAPKGFAPVTQDMTRLNQILDTFVAPDNVRFVTFIPAELLPAAQAGQTPDLTRTMSLQTNKKVVWRTVTASDFAEIKATVCEQNEAMVREAESKMPGFMEQASNNIQHQFNTKVDLSVNGIVALPPHFESDHSLAFSMLLNVTTTTADGQPTKHPEVVTATYLYARGKLFFTYVYGGEHDLEWTRQAAKDWAMAILAANPSDAATLAKESAHTGGIDWSRAFRSGLIGGLVGGAIGLYRYLLKRSKRKEAPVSPDHKPGGGDVDDF
jgi:hypothetical protein